jgi:hypothetical protein
MTRIVKRSIRWRTPVALAIIALMAAAILPTFAQGDPPAEPLIPNVEPGALAAAEAPALWTMAEREAVEATLAAYFAAGQAAAPEGAALRLEDIQAMSDAELAATYQLYLPLLRRPPELGQVTPTPVTPAPVTPTPVTPTPEPAKPADVVVTVWPKPSIWVARGAILEYEIRLKNNGKGDANQTRVLLPLNGNQVAVVSSSLNSRAGDWVSNATPSKLTVTFGRLGPGKSRSGKIFVRVGPNLAQATVLDVRASYSWSDGADGGGQRANWTPVLVGGGPSDAPYIWVQVTPDRGGPGTAHSFYTDRLLPGEGVSTWLNTPQGVRALSLRGTANAEGVVRLNFSSAGLARGTYQMVLYGQRSGLTGVATFIVQ